MKKALIAGVAGQDGSYLSEFLLKKGYVVIGTSRDAQASSFQNLKRLGVHDRIELRSMSLTDFRSILQVLKDVDPDEIYNLAGQSSVGLSFEQPMETFESLCLGTLNVLEAIRFLGQNVSFYNACSSECFGDTNNAPADENTPFHPRSPYAVAKAAAFWHVSNYREAYRLRACSGIFFNHESPLRPERFVTRKITAAACRIFKGSKECLRLGNIDIIRDWGWAPEYVQAMWMMLQQAECADYVVATGKSYPLQSFLEEVFSYLGLDWKKHIVRDQTLFRPSDIPVSRANPTKVKRELGWTAKFSMPEIARMMVDAELNYMEHSSVMS